MTLRGLIEAVGEGLEIPPELLGNVLTYDAKTGLLHWKTRSVDFFERERDQKAWNGRYAGKQAFTTKVRGYLAGTLFNRHVYAHRAAFTLMEGRWPEHVDHINGDKTDNRWANLREVTHVQNMRNLPIMSNNSSGIAGVSWIKARDVWRALIGVGGKSIFLGEYDTKEKAIIARAAAEKVIGFHENHGRPSAILRALEQEGRDE